MTSKQPIISSQTPDVPVQPTTPETGSSRVRDIAAGTALSVALLTNPAMAQVKDYYQAYMEQCTAQAAMAQASFREKMNAVIATEGGESPKAIKMQNALAASIERTGKKCEEGAQLEAKNAQLEAKNTQLEAKGVQIRQETAQIRQETAQIRQETAQIRQETAQLEAKGVQIRQETAQIRQETAQIVSIKSRFDKMGIELPQVDDLLRELISQKGSTSRKREIINQLDAFVSDAKMTLNLARNISSFQTSEYLRLFTSIEQQIEKIQHTLHGSKVAGL